MKKQNTLLAILIIFLAVLGIASIKKINKQSSKTNNENINQIANIKYNQEEKSPPASLSANKTMNKPAMIIDQNKNYEATLHTTAGDIVIALNAAATPITVNNFVYLARNNFYNNTTFHRVINGFMIQGGDQRGDGTGSPGYQLDDEVFEGEYTRGTIAMANSGPNTNGSQFFIMQQDYALPHNYVIFGKVISGMEVVDQIAAAKVTNNFSGELSKPVEPVVVTSIDIEEK